LSLISLVGMLVLIMRGLTPGRQPVIKPFQILFGALLYNGPIFMAKGLDDDDDDDVTLALRLRGYRSLHSFCAHFIVYLAEVFL